MKRHFLRSLLSTVLALCVISLPLPVYSGLASTQPHNAGGERARVIPQGSGIFGCALNAGVSSFDELGTVHPGGTGNPTLDVAIQTDILELQKLYGVGAKMFLLTEANGPNAFALSRPVPEVLQRFQLPAQATPDGMVFLGVNLMTNEYRTKFGTGYAIPSIIAHEYAHILQYKLGFPSRGKWQELHADYLAGWYTGHRLRFVPQNLAESIEAFFDIGDYDFNNPSHHGTPQERRNTFLAGLTLNLQSQVSSSQVAYNEGIKYLRQQGMR